MKFKAIITGPKAYIPGGVKEEDFEITEQDIEEATEDGESREEIIAYLKEEYCAAWEQHGCNIVLEQNN